MVRLSQPTESMRFPSQVAQGDSHVMGGTDQIGAHRSDPSVPHDSADVLTPGQLMRRLGLKHSQFCKYQKRGLYNHLMVKRPVGLGRYSKALVDRFFDGDSTVQLGRRS